MTLLEPIYLWLLLLALPVIALFSIRPRQRTVAVASLTLWRDLPGVARGGRRLLGAQVREPLRLLLVLLALLGTVFGLGRLGAGDDEPRAVVVVVDLSASMGARAEDGRTRLELAREQVDAILGGLAPGDRAWVVGAGQEARVAWGPVAGSFDARVEVEWGTRLSQELGRADLRGALELAAVILSLRSEARSELWVLSDGDPAAEESLQLPEEWPANTRIQCWETPASPLPNLRLEGHARSAGEGIELQAWVVNEGRDPGRAEPEVLLDGSLFGVLAAVEVEPGERRALDVLDLPRPGGGRLELRLRAGDALALDDALSWQVPPLRRVRVRLFDPSADRFLRAALDADAGLELTDGPCDVLVHTAPLPAGAKAEGVPRLRIGPAALPGDWSRRGDVEAPADVRAEAHPLFEGVVLEGLLLTSLTAVEGPAGWATVARADAHPLVLVRDQAPRQIALPFDPGASDLVLRRAFPLFVANAVRWLAESQPAEPRWVRAGFESKHAGPVHPDPRESRLDPRAELGLGERLAQAPKPPVDPRPWWILAAALALLIEGVLAVRARGPRIGLLTTRALLLGVLGVAWAGPTWTEGEGERPVACVVLVDESASVDADAALTSATEAILEARSRGEPVALGAYGGRVRVSRPRPGTTTWIGTLDGVDPERTDLARALRAAPAGFEAGHANRVLVVTDGRSPDASSAAEDLRSLGARLEFLLVPSRSAPEPRVVRFASAQPWVETGAGVRLDAELVAGVDTRTTARLRRVDAAGGERTWSRELTLGPTPTAAPISFVDRAGPRGLARYTLELPGGARGRLALPVRSGPRALLLEGTPGEGSAVARALSEAGFGVERRAPATAPEAALGWRPWDLVVLVDVPARDDLGAEALSSSAQRALADHVRGGGGLLVVGGERSFGYGGYRGAPLQEVLPLHSEPPAAGEVPSVALVLLIDRSASMRGPKLELAKVAAREAVSHLSPRDTVGVVGFFAEAEWTVSLQPAVDARGVHARIDLQSAGGGTDLVPALALARAGFEGLDVRVKHAVALTDGIAPRDDELLALARAARAEGVTLSTVGIGGDADQAPLANLARAGGGRHHAARGHDQLPRILVDEALTAARRAGQVDPFRPQVVVPAPAVRGVDFASGPPLSGHVPTRLKQGAQLWLQAPSEAPLLACWDVGLGRCAAFTSDGGLRWSRRWTRWPGFARLLRQTARTLAPTPPSVDGGARIELAPSPDGVRALVYGPSDPRPLELEVEAGGVPEFWPLEPVATGVWAAQPQLGERPGVARVRRGQEILAEAGLWPPLPGREHSAAPALPPGGAGAAAAPVPVSLTPPLLLFVCGLLVAISIARRG